VIETKVIDRNQTRRVRSTAISATAMMVGVMLCVPCLTTAARADDGDVDIAYGAGGSVVVDFDDLTTTIDGAAIQDDGKAVVVGRHMMGRFRVDGSLDPAFGSGGLVPFEGLKAYMRDVAIQPDGKIVVAGRTYFAKLAVARYHANGSLDQSFGAGGLVQFPSTSPYKADNIVVAVAGDGKIVTASNNGASTSEFLVARFTTSGSLDASFQGGIVTTPIGGSGTFAGVRDIALQPDGKIVVAGHSKHGHVLVRYTAAGVLDTSFNGLGIVIASASVIGFESAEQLALQADGRIVVAVHSASDWLPVVRYRSDGTLDPSFGVGGKASTPNAGHSIAIALQADGRILTASTTDVDAFHLGRLNGDGTLDTTFGTGGFTTFGFGEDRRIQTHTLQVQPDGRLLFAGTVADMNGSNAHWGLARFEGPTSHGLQFFLTGDANAASVGPQYAMTQNAPAAQTISAFLPAGVAWTTDVPLGGGFLGNASFRLRLPCTESLAAASNVTVVVSALTPGQPVQQIARVTGSRTVNCTAPVTIDIPKTARGQVQVSNRTLRLAISGSFASPDVDLELGAGAFLEATGFLGTP
jgi:uncharacterized delta-60 repeat protein